jgi:cellulose synthase/poly-beta-1,6-N-acetylglucosamine synthase-like glycosyltransferase
MSVIPLTLLVLSTALIAYSYIGYPLLLWLLSQFRSRRPAGPQRPPAEWPTISILVPAYNEEAAIGGALEHLLAADYPPHQRQILVVSDASTDRTDEMVRRFADQGVELLRLPERGGKTAAENAARLHLHGSIVVSTDASVRIHSRALKPLIASFADPSVGVASGRDVSVARLEALSNFGESGYVGYEMWVRDLETRVLGIVGASGSFYACRRGLYMSLVPEALSRDFAAALIARHFGYRSVSVTDAICYVPRVALLRREYGRKVRTITRGWETLFYKRQLLNPFQHGLFSWMLFSHKMCRWLVPWALLLGVLALIILDLERWEAWAPLGVGLVTAVALLAAAGWFWPAGRPMPRLLSLSAYFVSGNIAALHASLRALRGEMNPIWEPTRREVTDPAGATPGKV